MTSLSTRRKSCINRDTMMHMTMRSVQKSDAASCNGRPSQPTHSCLLSPALLGRRTFSFDDFVSQRRSLFFFSLFFFFVRILASEDIHYTIISPFNTSYDFSRPRQKLKPSFIPIEIRLLPCTLHDAPLRYLPRMQNAKQDLDISLPFPKGTRVLTSSMPSGSYVYVIIHSCDTPNAKKIKIADRFLRSSPTIRERDSCR